MQPETAPSGTSVTPASNDLRGTGASVIRCTHDHPSSLGVFVRSYSVRHDEALSCNAAMWRCANTMNWRVAGERTPLVLVMKANFSSNGGSSGTQETRLALSWDRATR